MPCPDPVRLNERDILRMYKRKLHVLCHIFDKRILQPGLVYWRQNQYQYRVLCLF